jgi:hypothetical protein
VKLVRLPMKGKDFRKKICMKNYMFYNTVTNSQETALRHQSYVLLISDSFRVSPNRNTKRLNRNKVDLIIFPHEFNFAIKQRQISIRGIYPLYKHHCPN